MTDRFVAVGGSHKIATSDNGTSWTQRTNSFSGTILCIAYGDDHWVAIDSDDNVGWSNDGITWHVSAGPFSHANALAWSGNEWIAVDDFGGIFRSINGISWTTQTTGLPGGGDAELMDVCWDPYNAQFMAVGADFTDNSEIEVVSDDGIEWSRYYTPPTGFEFLGAIGTDGSGTIIIANSPSSSTTTKLAKSVNAGVSWTPKTTPFTGTFRATTIGWGDDGWFIAGGGNGILSQSGDGGDTWDAITSQFGTSSIFGTAYCQSMSFFGTWVIVGAGGKLSSSTDATTWTSRTSSFGTTLIQDVAFGSTSTWTPAYTFDADAITRIGLEDSFTADAEIVGAGQFLFPINAVLKGTPESAFAADAAIGIDITSDTTGRNPHDRGEQHFGNMPATVVVYDVFSTVETQLRGLWDRIMAYETRVGGLTSFTVDSIVRKTHTATFNINAAFAAFTPGGSWLVDAIVRRTQAFSATANAITKRVQSSSGTLDAVLKRTTSGSLTADGVLKSIRTGSFTIDGYVLVAGVSTFTGNAVLLRTQAGSLTANAIMKVARAGSFVTDAVIAIGRAGSATANAVVKKTISGTFTADATIVGGRNPDAGIGRVSAEAIELWAANHTASPTTPTGAGVSQEVIELWTAMLGAAYATEDVLELWSAISGKARVSQEVLELWAATHTASPTTPTGAGVSQEVLEVWTAETGPAKVSQEIIEIWTQEE